MSKIIGKRPPTEKTPGILGQEYIDSTTGKTYVCTHVNYGAVNDEPAGEIEGRYTWVEGSGGISDPKDIPDMYYETKKTEYILENFNLGGTYHHGMGNMMCPLSPVANFNNLEDGQKCYLDFNGTIYDGMFISSGNPRINFENVEFNGKTFPVSVRTEEIAMSDAYMTDDSVWSTAIISIYVEVVDIHCIDPKYIKDMYHAEPGKLYELENLDISNITLTDSLGLVMLSKPLRIVSGRTYYLDYAGEIYTAVAEHGVVVFENIYTPDYPSTDPITFNFQSSYPGFRVLGANDRTRNWEGMTISLYNEGDVISPIPTKYLPTPILFSLGTDDTVQCSHSFDEVMDFIEKGFVNIIFYCDQGSGGEFRWPIHFKTDMDGLMVGFGDMHRRIFRIRYREDGTLSYEMDDPLQ